MKPKLFPGLLLYVLLGACAVLETGLQGGNAPVAGGLAVAAPPGTKAPGKRLEITMIERGARGELTPIGQNGSVTTWLSQDGISVSLDRGVLVATRGLGADLMAVNAQETLDALAAPSGEYRRTYRFLDAEMHADYLLAGCRMETQGPEIVGNRKLTRNVEDCRSFRGEHRNIYWTDPSGAIMASRQWISPQIGALLTTQY